MFRSFSAKNFATLVALIALLGITSTSGIAVGGAALPGYHHFGVTPDYDVKPYSFGPKTN